MLSCRSTFFVLAKGALALGLLSGLTLAPHAAFAQYSLSTLVTFNGAGNGASPLSGFTSDSSGNLYGTTYRGGTNNTGSIYKITKASGAFSTIASFGANGSYPQAGITFDSNGNLYGVTAAGGTYDYGTVFKVAPNSTVVQNVASFSKNSSLYNTQGAISSVVFDSSGNLYGTAQYGGANGVGSVYEIVKGTTNIVDIATFDGSNGSNPYGGLTIDGSGNLFGTTLYDTSGNGSVFEIVQGSGTISNLANFNGSGSLSAVTLDGNGDIYGTTELGGLTSQGSIWKITHGTTVITDIASFSGNNGSDARGGVSLDATGNLFGTANGGGAHGHGVVYEIAHGSSTLSDLVSFSGADGAGPWGGITLDGQGNLYGTTANGGLNNSGTVFKLTPNGSSASAAPELAQAATLGLVLTGIAALLVRARRRPRAAPEAA